MPISPKVALPDFVQISYSGGRKHEGRLTRQGVWTLGRTLGKGEVESSILSRSTIFIQ